MKKKIVFVQPVLSPYTVPRFEKLATDEEFEIYIFLETANFPHRPGWHVQDVEKCRVEVLHSFTVRAKATNRELAYAIEGVRCIPYNLPCLIARHSPNIIVVTNATELFFCLFLRPLMRYKIGLIVEDTKHSVAQKVRVKKGIKSFVSRRADFFLPLSNDSVDYLKAIGIREHVYRTSWSIDLNQSRQEEDNEEISVLKEKHNLYGKVVFITVAQLVPRKGILDMCKAWHELPEPISKGTALIIIGDGPQKEEIQDFLNVNNISNIYLLGHKPYKDVIYYYRLANVFILPTLEDLFALVVMEAMAARLPVLISKYCGARELVHDGLNGYVFDPAKAEDIKNAIVRLYRRKEDLPIMGETSFRFIQKYSTQKVIYDLAKILKGI